MPHGHCYLWKPWLVGLHVVSDFLIGMAYISISLTLYALVKRINISFNRIVLCFGVFIGACGLTHFMEIWNLWNADYWWAAWVKVITAIASVFTGIYLWRLQDSIVNVAEAAKLAEEHRLNLEVMVRVKTEDFNAIANFIPQLAWKANAEGFISWYNQRWYDFTGTTLESMQGWGWQNVHHPDHVDRVTSNWKSHLANGDDWEDTFPLKRHDGQWRWFLSRARPIKDESGKISYWLGTNTDITEEREIRAELNKAVSARDEFLSIASHELKTPLTALSLNTQMIQRMIAKKDERAYQPERIENFVDQTIRQSDRLSRLVDDMLDISRIESGNLAIQLDKINLPDILIDMKNRFDEQFKQRTGEELKLETLETLITSLDRMRIEQVISNLLTNALEYGKGLPVTMKLEQKDKAAEIKVIDHGMGIAPSKREVIFDRFERAGVDANEVSGLGLGLYITKEIVLAHKGLIWVEDTPGGGSTFVVRLPMK